MKKALIIALHIAYWVCYLFLLVVILKLIFQTLPQKSIPLNYHFTTLFCLFTLIPAIISFYGFYCFLIDFITQKRFIPLALLVGLILFVAASTTSIILSLFQQNLIFGNGLQTVIEVEIMFLALSLIHGSLGLILRGFLKWFADIKIKKELVQKSFEAELALIKAQLDPHFLFNTLNNIDVLIEKDTQKASLFLNKLSEIMRFMLYETKADKIPLSKEIDYIQKYIDLQRIRTSNTYFVHFELLGESKNLSIAPMILIPFIENAFKHTPPQKSEVGISIKISIDNDHLGFQCKNTLYATTPTHISGGLGNDLIIKRLALIYPQNHSLVIDKNSDYFYVNLSIHLV